MNLRVEVLRALHVVKLSTSGKWFFCGIVSRSAVVTKRTGTNCLGRLVSVARYSCIAYCKATLEDRGCAALKEYEYVAELYKVQDNAITTIVFFDGSFCNLRNPGLENDVRTVE